MQTYSIKKLFVKVSLKLTAKHLQVCGLHHIKQRDYFEENLRTTASNLRYLKSVQIRGFLCSVFYCIWTQHSINLRIQSKYRKILNRKNAVVGHAVLPLSLKSVKSRMQPLSSWNLYKYKVKVFQILFVKVIDLIS